MLGEPALDFWFGKRQRTLAPGNGWTGTIAAGSVTR
jgi:hypothetical protein